MMSGGGSDGVSADGRYTVTTRCGSDDVVVGDLFVARDRGVFRYSGDWLRHPDAYELAPSLPMTGGNQPLDGLGPFGDSAPDRWGRQLAMSALEARDGDGGDWLDLVDVAKIHGADTGEMWRRTAFGVLIGNTDDHLRNHGFPRIGRTWEVAPAFDVNPTPLDARDEHQMTLFGSGALTLADVLTDDALALFGVSRRAASAWCTRAAVVLAGALERARRAGLSDRDVAVMESRFADAVAQAGTATGS